MFTIGSWTVFAAAFWLNTNSRWSLLEGVCTTFAALAALHGFLLKDPDSIVLGCIIANTIGIIPTALSCWKNPHGEPPSAWLLWLIGSILFIYLEKMNGMTDSLTSAGAFAFEEFVIFVVLRWRLHTSSTFSQVRIGRKHAA